VNNITRDNIVEKIGWRHFVALCSSAREGLATRPRGNSYPAPVQVASVEDVKSQEAQRNAEQWNGYIAAVRAQFPLTAEQEQEIRSGVVDERVRQWAEEEKQRMIKDRGFRTKYSTAIAPRPRIWAWWFRSFRSGQ
jgi:hypothetical protein